VAVVQCDTPSDAYASALGDCDDLDDAINPGADEVCDPDDVDEDCDGAADDADGSTEPSSFLDFYADVDEDFALDVLNSGVGASAPLGGGGCFDAGLAARIAGSSSAQSRRSSSGSHEGRQSRAELWRLAPPLAQSLRTVSP
jgi:hypothetical protein